MTQSQNNSPQIVKINVIAATFTGASVFITTFVSCWIFAIITPHFASHMYISLFSSGNPTSQAALIGGLIPSLFFGAWTGFLVAFFYNLASRFGVRN